MLSGLRLLCLLHTFKSTARNPRETKRRRKSEKEKLLTPHSAFVYVHFMSIYLFFLVLNTSFTWMPFTCRSNNGNLRSFCDSYIQYYAWFAWPTHILYTHELAYAHPFKQQTFCYSVCGAWFHLFFLFIGQFKFKELCVQTITSDWVVCVILFSAIMFVMCRAMCIDF